MTNVEHPQPVMDFLQLTGKSILVFGVANRKSVAWHIARVLTEAGAQVVYVVRSPARKASLEKLAPGAPVYVCDVAFPEQIAALRAELAARSEKYHGLVHSLAFADYVPPQAASQPAGDKPGSDKPGDKPEPAITPFHETPRAAFLQAVDISCYSLIALSQALQDLLDPDASVVTISISTTRMASVNYGFMAPVKAALDSTVVFLAKSFSQFSRIRFNAVCPGLLKTSASAGIPGYVDSYLYAEQMTLRKQAVATEEAANTAAFLLSPRSSGINAQGIVVDAGMSVNYFDAEMVRKAMRE